jgi:hypothetical protein
MQHCNMFQTHVFNENFNKVLMQCSHSKHVNIIKCEVPIAIKQNLYVLMQVSHLSKLFKMSKKWKTWTPCHCLCQRNLNNICMLLSNLKRHLSKPIFISHNVMCSLINSWCCNHFSSMLMSVKLIVIRLELNDIGYKLVFHSYSKFVSNTWYTLICKFEKYKSSPKNYMGMNIYNLLDFKKKKNSKKNWK